MRRSVLFCLLTAAALAGAPILPAGDLALESKPTKTRLLELFTSEGCSSCPPAEAWVSKLKSDPRLWHDFVPIAFHVDYWDHLGWRDPFAAKEWTARQYQYSASWKSSSVYTPGFVLDGREWRNAGALPPATETPGVLKVTLTNGDQVHAMFRSTSEEKRPLAIHVARLGFGLSSKVEAGENSGRKLLHDFVVLSLVSERMPADLPEVTFSLGEKKQSTEGPGAIAAWITEPGQLQPIQAVGGWR